MKNVFKAHINVVFIFLICLSFFAKGMEKKKWHLTIKFNDKKTINMPEKVFNHYAEFCDFLGEGVKKIDGFFKRDQLLALNVSSEDWKLFDSAADIAFPEPLFVTDWRSYVVTARWVGQKVEKEKKEKLKKVFKENSLEQVASIAKVSSTMKEYGLLCRITKKSLYAKIAEEIFANPNKFLEPGVMNKRINALNLDQENKKDLKEKAQELIKEDREHSYKEKLLQ